MRCLKYAVWSVVVVGLVVAGLACKRTTGSGSDREAADLLLKDDDIIGLKKSGEASLANDLNSLYDIINGGAQIYIDNGFEEGVFQTYVQGASSFTLEIYDQAGVAGARAVYDELYPASAELFFSGENREAVVDQSRLSSYSIQHYQDRFFIRINTTEKNDAALNMAKLICSNILGKLTEEP
jgi:hypothetical protein